MGFFKKPVLKKIFRKAKNEIERELQVDLDKDGKIGSEPSNGKKQSRNVPQAIPVVTYGTDVTETNIQGTELVSIILPEDVKEGDMTNVVHGGNVYPVTIPKGSQPGGTLKIRLPKTQVGISEQRLKLSKIPFHSKWSTYPEQPIEKIPLGHIPGFVDSRRAIPGSGRTKSLLVGINYPGTKAELKGCINDIGRIRNFLIEQGYSDSPESMVLLADSPNGLVGSRNVDGLPTKANIIKGLQWLSSGCKEGDLLFFHYSGHGAQQRDPEGGEQDGMNETICPSDFQANGMLSDDKLWGLLVWPLPAGVKLTALMDCCHSGTGLDLPFGYKFVKDYSKTSKKLVFNMEPNPSLAYADVTLFSGCADDETSLDSTSYDKKQKKRIASGAMTTAFLEAWSVFEKIGRIPTYFEFLNQIHKCLDVAHPDQEMSNSKPFPFLNFGGRRQQPQLSSCQNFDIHERFVSFDGLANDAILLNSNEKVGRLVSHHFHPKIDLEGTGIGDMLMGILKDLAAEHGERIAKELLSKLIK